MTISSDRTDVFTSDVDTNTSVSDVDSETVYNTKASILPTNKFVGFLVLFCDHFGLRINEHSFFSSKNKQLQQ